jgi:hypothetical protein
MLEVWHNHGNLVLAGGLLGHQANEGGRAGYRVPWVLEPNRHADEVDCRRCQQVL